MPTILVISGSPSASSKTAALAEQLADRLGEQDHRVRAVAVRTLPAEALLAADPHHPRIAEVVRAIAEADGLVVASPVYKAAYTGVLKALLDLLPQFAFAGKVVLPLLTGGSPAHVLALDYALRPVLNSLGAHHIVQGYFVLDKHIERTDTGIALAEDAERTLLSIVDTFSAAVHRRRGELLAAS
ncbi:MULTISPECIES: NADPH-dependent FMN reductase [unclassified Crossiella]|uniref:NADPH-dependent FMN reductase n=1 Tax=unclassified Crossiella TaxID=2620835 RepID=UPI001FFE323E|nr:MULTISPECIES: NADPH-dependent FMN reductase [unclassified Crossiella]MCK2241806.1 NADPH-dependent FMN reductase [Crossiella sp. S99.2]MCK2255709.1 NADPH-dependent FMN reductase [Crossiella sp. S99.1]